MKFDFSGYATKNDLKCADGRTIRHNAFKENDGQTVPLVWQHIHNDPGNVLGHAVLENRDDGVYAFCKFNDTPAGQNTKLLVQHGDVTSLSIYANKLVQKGQDVIHGAIREVSLVLSGANPGALIDNLSIAHSDGGYTDVDDEAIIYTGLPISEEELEHEDKEEKKDMSQNGSKTVQDVFDSMSEEQKNVVYAMLAQATEDVEHGYYDEEDELEHDNLGGGYNMKRNVFDNDQNNEGGAVLSHSQIKSIFEDAQKTGSLKESMLAHAQTYGIEDIDILFPDAKTLTPTPDFISRRMGWVPGVINGTHHSPFSRIKSVHADITADEARAKGYVKASLKTEEVFGLIQRVTTPTTIYKKQKLDRDDIIDITDLDVVAWLKMEMRMMLDEELAKAVLIGDGREPGSPDKIKEEHIRPIYKDADMYAHKVTLENKVDTDDIVEAIIRSRKHYKGSGNPVLYTTTDLLTDMLLSKDQMGRRLYSTEAELASALRVSSIVEVEVMDGVSRADDDESVDLDLLGIIVNLKDYNMGADKGGQVSMFDDFDIDYNQYKYLIETRCSGALTKPKSAIVIERRQAEVEIP